MIAAVYLSNTGNEPHSWWFWALGGTGSALMFWALLRLIAYDDAKAALEDAGFDRRVHEVRAVASQPPGTALEEEIGQALDMLSDVADRLSAASANAREFESRVRELVDQAEAAEATNRILGDDAAKIGALLARQTELIINEKLDQLALFHAQQTKELRRSGKRTAWFTFVGGVLLGWLGNVVVPLLVASN